MAASARNRIARKTQVRPEPNNGRRGYTFEWHRIRGWTGGTALKLLVLNSGSSSIKYRLFLVESMAVVRAGVVDRIGEPGPSAVRDHGEGFGRVMADLSKFGSDRGPGRPVRHRAPGRPRRRAFPGAGTGGPRNPRCDPGDDPLRPAAQSRQPPGDRGRPRDVPGGAAGGGLRHRLPPDDASPGLPLRPPPRSVRQPIACGATASTGPRTPTSPGAPPTSSESRRGP